MLLIEFFFYNNFRLHITLQPMQRTHQLTITFMHRRSQVWAFSTGAGFGPLVFGLIRDHFQNFAPALQISAVILPVCAAGFLFLGKYPKFSR